MCKTFCRGNEDKNKGGEIGRVIWLVSILSEKHHMKLISNEISGILMI